LDRQPQEVVVRSDFECTTSTRLVLNRKNRRDVLGEEEKTLLFERVVGPVDIDDVSEMEKDEVLVSSVGDGGFRR
jgi:hypothetical protein